MGAPAVEPGRVLVVGDVIDDVIVRPLAPVRRGTDTRAQIVATPGGSGANQAAWLAAEGAPVRFVGRVGAGDVARHRDTFAAAGVDAHLVADAEAATGRIVILVDPADGERTMFTDRGANLHLQRADLPDELLDGVAWLHLSGYSLFDPAVRAAVLDLAARAARRSIPLSVDPASTAFLDEVGPASFLDQLPPIHLLLPNLDEGRLLTGEHEPEEIVRRLHDHVEVVALKLGAAGAMVARRGFPPVRATAVATAVVDTTGAGDAFCGAFVAARLRGASDGQAARAGVAAGAQAVAVAGARPSAASL